MRKPTEKQKKFVKGLVEGKSKRRAALDAGYSVNVADNPNRDILGKPGTETALSRLQKALEIISEEDIAITVKHAMLADKSDMTGKVYPDHRVRLQAAETAAKYKGADPAQKHDIDVHGDMNIQVINYADFKKDE